MQKRSVARLCALALTVILVVSLCITAFAKYQTIPFGEKSDTVRVMQTALKRKGYYKGAVDGNFGPTTRRAVMRFQSSLGIKADGKPGNKTLTALYDGGSKAINEIIARKATAVKVTDPGSLYYGCTGSRVRTLQKALKAAGYFKGSIDGKFGDLTELAVRKFQTAKGIHVDGIAGKTTQARLNRAQKAVTLRTSFLLDYGSKGETVKTVQRTLRNLGYTPDASIKADQSGVYGQSTANVVSKWQKATKRNVTGTLSEKEYNALIMTKSP